MSKQVRVYDYTYSVPVDRAAGSVVNASTPQYFTGYSFLLDKQVKAISIMETTANSCAGLSLYLTLKDKSGKELLKNFPMSDLIVVNTPLGSPLNRLRLFKLEGIDLNNSYYQQSLNVGFGFDARILIINFHY